MTRSRLTCLAVSSLKKHIIVSCRGFGDCPGPPRCTSGRRLSFADRRERMRRDVGSSGRSEQVDQRDRPEMPNHANGEDRGHVRNSCARTLRSSWIMPVVRLPDPFLLPWRSFWGYHDILVPTGEAVLPNRGAQSSVSGRGDRAPDAAPPPRLRGRPEGPPYGDRHYGAAEAQAARRILRHWPVVRSVATATSCGITPGDPYVHVECTSREDGMPGRGQRSD